MHPKGYARALFVDFSSAFNSMKRHILLKRLLDLNINTGLVVWIRGSVSGRTCQTCCPQGCVLSSVLFSLFTNEFMINEEHFRLFKYADDMALVGLLQETGPLGEAAYLAHATALQTWCHTSQLEINVAETKELIMCCTKQHLITEPVSLDGQHVETVEHFKYLGTVLDTQVSFSENTEYIFKRCSQRLYLLRKLSGLGVSRQILELVYKTIVESDFNL